MKYGAIFHTHHMIHIDGKLIFFSNARQELFALDMRSGVVEKLFRPKGTRAIRVFEYYRGEYYFFELFEKNVVIWNPVRNCINKEAIPDGMIGDNQVWELSLFRYGNIAYFLGASSTVLSYDLENRSWKRNRYFDDCVTSFEDIELKPIATPFVADEKLYIPFSGNKARFMIFDQEATAMYREYDISDDVDEIIGYAKYLNDIYVYAKNKSGDGQIYHGYFDGEKLIFNLLLSIDDFNSYFQIVATKDFLYLIPCRYDKAYKIDCRIPSIDNLINIPLIDRSEFGKDFTDNYNYVSGINVADKYYMIHPWSLSLLCIDQNNSEIITSPITVLKNCYMYIDDSDILEENPVQSLDELFEIIGAGENK